MNDIWGNRVAGINYTNFYGNTLPRYELIKVNGEESAKNFRMAPNSDALLLDENNPILYHVQTDGAGYLSVNSYDLILHQPAPQVDINLLNQRVSQLEELLNARQSNSQSKKKQHQSTTAVIGDATT